MAKITMQNKLNTMVTVSNFNRSNYMKNHMGAKEEIDKNGDVHLLTGQACWALKDFEEEFLEKDHSMEGLENTESYAYVSLIPLLVLVSPAMGVSVR